MYSPFYVLQDYLKPREIPVNFLGEASHLVMTNPDLFLRVIDFTGIKSFGNNSQNECKQIMELRLVCKLYASKINENVWTYPLVVVKNLKNLTKKAKFRNVIISGEPYNPSPSELAERTALFCDDLLVFSGAWSISFGYTNIPDELFAKFIDVWNSYKGNETLHPGYCVDIYATDKITPETVKKLKTTKLLHATKKNLEFTDEFASQTLKICCDLKVFTNLTMVCDLSLTYSTITDDEMILLCEAWVDYRKKHGVIQMTDNSIFYNSSRITQHSNYPGDKLRLHGCRGLTDKSYSKFWFVKHLEVACSNIGDEGVSVLSNCEMLEMQYSELKNVDVLSNLKSCKTLKIDYDKFCVDEINSSEDANYIKVPHRYRNPQYLSKDKLLILRELPLEKIDLNTISMENEKEIKEWLSKIIRSR